MKVRRLHSVIAVVVAAAFAGWVSAAWSINARASATIRAQASSQTLVAPHTLTVCSDIPAAPFEYYDQHQHLTGFDVAVVDAVAARMRRRTAWVNSVFDTIFEAMQGGKCDMIATSMYILPQRLKQVAMLPYFTSGESFLVAKGNPHHFPVNAITKPRQLCGLKIAVELGSAEADDAKTFSSQCRNAGKPAITLIHSTKLTDALQQVQSGFAAALFYDSAENSYYANAVASTRFEVVGGVRNVIPYGFGFLKGKNPLLASFTKRLKILEHNGTYTRLLKRWGLQGTKIPAPISEQ